MADGLVFLGILLVVIVIGLVLWLVCTNSYNESNTLVAESLGPYSELKEFIQKTVIPSFHHQRIEGDQFAVLLLTDTRLADIKSTVLRPRDQQSGRPKVNSDCHYYPMSSQEQDNYLVARPRHQGGHTTHAESTLVDELDNLMRAYERRRNQTPPTHILLYSWIMPCDSCTRQICEKLPSQNCDMTVVYTIDYWRLNLFKNAWNRQALEKAGIRVIRVGYPPRLPPAGK